MNFNVWPSGCGDEDESWRELRRRFIEWRIQAVAPEAAWRIVTVHPWYHRRLRELAAGTVRWSELPVTAAEDVAQEAVLSLMRRMRLAPDLNFDPALPEEFFPVWLGRFIEIDCYRAARRLKRRSRREVPLAFEPACDPRRPPDEPRDLAGAIAELRDPDRQVLDEARRGRTLRQTADRAGLTYEQTKRAYHRGLRALRERFVDGE